MRLAGQISAGIEVLAEVIERHRPASLALAEWGRSHRFAGSRDRSAIGTLVFDALRRRASLGWRMGEETPRVLALATLRDVWQISAEEIAAICDGSQHAPAALTEQERRRLEAGEEVFADAPGWVRAELPEWLYAELVAGFGDGAATEGRALAERAPIDLRVNTLKADRPRVVKALEKYGAEPTPFSPWGVRIAPPGPQDKNPNVEAEAGHGKGWYELQDEASQIATHLAGVGPRQQVLDLCAGSGGKTLGFAALMQNTGQIHAYDADKQRLRPVFERLKRAGVRNAQVLAAGDETALAALEGRIDVVFVDAPCSGSGVWRRRPDAKWRISPEALAQRIEDQRAVLRLGAPLVKPGGRLVYATCSVLPSENQAQTAWFLASNPDFTQRNWRECWQTSALGPAPAVLDDKFAMQLSPARQGTDGFFVSIFDRLS
jgi:16S rRNA (cytosine967-C5)-methyltransferase